MKRLFPAVLLALSFATEPLYKRKLRLNYITVRESAAHKPEALARDPR